MCHFIGLDVHWRYTTMCVLDSNGQIVERRKVVGTWENVAQEVRRFESAAVCYEASCGYGHLHRLLSAFAPKVVVAHPGQLRLIFRSKRKNDRVDAEKLAKLLYFDEVPTVHVPPESVQAWRQMIEYRNALISKRTRAKNSCRSLLRSLGIRTPRQPALWTRAGQRWLRQLELPNSFYAVRRDMLCDEIEQFQKQLHVVEQVLDQFSQNHPSVFVLRSIPGVGARTAEALAAYIDDPSRFRRSKSIGSYLGMVPCQDQSGSVNRLGHITRQGPASVRRLLTEAAWQAIRRSPTVAAYFQRICNGDPGRRKLALVATAHYLARVSLALLKRGELWNERVAG